MSSSDDFPEVIKASRRRQKRRSHRFLILLAGILIVTATAGALYLALRPVTLRIAVPGSDDQKLVQALAQMFARERSAVRLSLISTDGEAESISLLAASETDLAVARGDLEMPT